jgi:uncharacterized membrane protein YbhN (UPF0104 family)
MKTGKSGMRKHLSKFTFALFGVSIGLVLGWFAIRGAHWALVRQTLSGWSLIIIAAGIILVLTSSYLRAIRWSLLWPNRRLSAVRLMIVENAALGLNNLAPVRIFDEGVEVAILSLRDKLPPGQIIATMMMSRLQDLIFTLTFISVSLVFLPPLWEYSWVIAGGVFFCIAWMTLLLTFEPLVKRFPVLLRIPGVNSFQLTIKTLWGMPKKLSLTFTLTGAYWLLLVPVGVIFAREAGITLPFYLIMVTMMGAIFFSTSVPGLPGAIGTFEFAVVSLLNLWDVPQENSLSFAIALHAVLFLPITAFTLFVLPREGFLSIRAARELFRKRG